MRALSLVRAQASDVVASTAARVPSLGIPHHATPHLFKLVKPVNPLTVRMCPLCHYVFQKAVARTGWMFIITPALTGSVILVLVAVIGHNATGVRSYPKNWW